MGLKKYKPRSAALRFTTLSDFEGVSKKRPERGLIEIKKSQAGRNAQGRITVRHRGGGPDDGLEHRPARHRDPRLVGAAESARAAPGQEDQRPPQRHATGEFLAPVTV